MKKFAKTVLKHRLAKGWTQAELADRSKIGQSRISDYELGRREPKLGSAVKLANAFQISLDVLAGRKKVKGGAIMGYTFDHNKGYKITTKDRWK